MLPIYGGQNMVVLRASSRAAPGHRRHPGRVMTTSSARASSSTRSKAVVLDEADEMLRMGFIDDVRVDPRHTPAERQTALFSATMPNVIRDVARRHLRNPREIKIRRHLHRGQDQPALLAGARRVDKARRAHPHPSTPREASTPPLVFVRTEICHRGARRQAGRARFAAAHSTAT